jgi:hypothetical protein
MAGNPKKERVLYVNLPKIETVICQLLPRDLRQFLPENCSKRVFSA